MTEEKRMTDAERTEQLDAKIQHAYQVIGTLVAGPDGPCEDFSSIGGQRTLGFLRA